MRLVLHPEDFTTAGADTEIGRELDEGRQADGVGRTCLGLEADADDIEGRDWKGVLVRVVAWALGWIAASYPAMMSRVSRSWRTASSG